MISSKVEIENAFELIHRANNEQTEEIEKLLTEVSSLREKLEKIQEEKDEMLKAVNEAIDALTTAHIREKLCETMLGRETMVQIAIAAERIKEK